MAIGSNWAEGAFVDSSWSTTAWQGAAYIFAVVIERVQIIAKAIRTQIIGP